MFSGANVRCLFCNRMTKFQQPHMALPVASLSTKIITTKLTSYCLFKDVAATITFMSFRLKSKENNLIFMEVSAGLQ